MSINHEASSVSKVSSLIRHDLGYDGEALRQQPGLKKIIGLHGANIASLVRLAEKGHFSGGAPQQRGFHLVPNIHYGKKWPDPVLSADIAAIKQARPAQNPLLKAIEYAETSPGEVGHSSNIGEEFTESPINKEVVIAFGLKALQAGAEIYIDAYGEDTELILPQAPIIESITGIYPVNEFSAQALKVALEQLRQ
jgi:hypothetical protein